MKTNLFDENEFNAFIQNESRISTDDRDEDERTPDLCCGIYEDEFSPDAYFGDDLDSFGRNFSDADPGL